MEREITKPDPINDEDWDHMKMLENAADSLDKIRCGIEELPQSDHFLITNETTGQGLEIHPTEAVILEGAFNGAATELYQAGLGEVVEGIAHRHGIIIERETDEQE